MSERSGGSENVDPGSGEPKTEDRSTQYADDILRMLEHCRERGIGLPRSIEAGARGIRLETLARGEEGATADLGELIRLHGRLSALVEPATPRSLAATKLSWRNKRARSTMVLVCSLILAALIGIGMYIATIDLVDQPAQAATAGQAVGDPASSDGADVATPGSQGATACDRSVFWSQLNYFFAALLGAAFNGLVICYGYLRKRSFDPIYILSYYIRLAVGIIAGMIVANLGDELFKGESILNQLGPGMIALLGGYSAGAVRLILDRLVDVLVTTVTGRDTTGQDRESISKDVLEISQVAADSKTPSEVREKLDELLPQTAALGGDPRHPGARVVPSTHRVGLLVSSGQHPG